MNSVAFFRETPGQMAPSEAGVGKTRDLFLPIAASRKTLGNTTRSSVNPAADQRGWGVTLALAAGLVASGRMQVPASIRARSQVFP